jgi:hypothetical protein
MTKRTLHIGIVLQRQHVSDVSLAGIIPLCGPSSTQLQKIFFLRSIALQPGAPIAARLALAESPDTKRLGERFDPFHDPYLADPYPFFAEAQAATPAFYRLLLDYWVVTVITIFGRCSRRHSSSPPSTL